MTKTSELYLKLQEAANTGEWLESRLHLMFTEIADNMFGEGYLARDERKALSHAIGEALNAFRTTVEADAKQLYSRGRWTTPEQQAALPALPGVMVQESGEMTTMFVPLLEQAVRRDGTIPLKLIQPGWGSSGYYPAEVLERDGPKVFPLGTQMFWNHATQVEEAERPEGDLNDLAAVLTSTARWEANGVAGPGLYANAKVFEGYQAPVNEMAPHIGVSIRASGRAAQGEAEGRKGPIIQQIATAKSIDFVTKPGAGGQIVQMFEAARSGQPVKIVPSVPVVEAKKEAGVEIEKQLQEAQGRLTKLEQENARLQEALLLRDAREVVQAELIKSSLPAVTQARLLETLAAKPAVGQDGTLDRTAYVAQIAEAVKAETAYLSSVTGHGSGKIAGMGGSSAAPVDEAALGKRMSEGFAALGLSEKEAKHAIAGRAR